MLDYYLFIIPTIGSIIAIYLLLNRQDDFNKIEKKMNETMELNTLFFKDNLQKMTLEFIKNLEDSSKKFNSFNDELESLKDRQEKIINTLRHFQQINLKLEEELNTKNKIIERKQNQLKRLKNEI